MMSIVNIADLDDDRIRLVEVPRILVDVGRAAVSAFRPTNPFRKPMLYKPGLLRGKSRARHRGRHWDLPGIALALGGRWSATSRSRAGSRSTWIPRSTRLKQHGVRALALAGDVRDPAAVEAVVTRTAEHVWRNRHPGQRRRRQFRLPRRKPIAERLRHGRRHRSEGHLQRVSRSLSAPEERAEASS